MRVGAPLTKVTHQMAAYPLDEEVSSLANEA